MEKEQPRMADHWTVKYAVCVGGLEVVFAEDERDPTHPAPRPAVVLAGLPVVVELHSYCLQISRHRTRPVAQNQIIRGLVAYRQTRSYAPKYPSNAWIWKYAWQDSHQ